MKKQNIILSDYLTKEEKEELARKSLEKEKKDTQKGKLFIILSLIFLILNATVTSILYPSVMNDVIMRAFFVTDDFSSNFLINAIVILIIIMKAGLVIAAIICSAIHKGTRPMIIISSSLITFTDLLLTVLQAADQYTYQDSAKIFVMFISIFCLALSCVCIYMSVFTDKISKYIYSKTVN